MLPQFGCGIHDLVFAPNDSVTAGIIVQQVRDALVAFEPRIDVLEVETLPGAGEPNLLLIRTTYRIRSSNTIGNLVYPYYIKEGA
jgi:phage baseplate assembly protein W